MIEDLHHRSQSTLQRSERWGVAAFSCQRKVTFLEKKNKGLVSKCWNVLKMRECWIFLGWARLRSFMFCGWGSSMAPKPLIYSCSFSCSHDLPPSNCLVQYDFYANSNLESGQSQKITPQCQEQSPSFHKATATKPKDSWFSREADPVCSQLVMFAASCPFSSLLMARSSRASWINPWRNGELKTPEDVS